MMECRKEGTVLFGSPAGSGDLSGGALILDRRFVLEWFFFVLSGITDKDGELSKRHSAATEVLRIGGTKKRGSPLETGSLTRTP